MPRLLKENFLYGYVLWLALIIMMILTASCNLKDAGQDEKLLYECRAYVQCLYDAEKHIVLSIGTNEISECKNIKNSLLVWSR